MSDTKYKTNWTCPYCGAALELSGEFFVCSSCHYQYSSEGYKDAKESAESEYKSRWYDNIDFPQGVSTNSNSTSSTNESTSGSITEDSVCGSVDNIADATCESVGNIASTACECLGEVTSDVLDVLGDIDIDL